MKYIKVLLLMLCCSCIGQPKKPTHPARNGEPKIIGPKILDSGYPLPIAVFTDATRTNVHYSGWTSYGDFYIADPDDQNSPIIIHEKVSLNDTSFSSASNHVAQKYGFDYFEIDILKKSVFYQNHNLDIAHGLAKTKLNQKAATAIIQAQNLNNDSILTILTVVQNDLFEKWAGINILLMEMGYIQTFKTLPQEKIELATYGSPAEKIEYFEKVNAAAQTAIANNAVRKGKVNEEIIRMLSDQTQFEAIQFQWDMHNDILYGTGW